MAKLRALLSDIPELAALVRIEANYFEANAMRMRYPEFRRQGLFVGSGVIEAGCKTVIGSRLKRSGMFWTVRGANAVLALRCSQHSRRFNDYWECRRGCLQILCRAPSCLQEGLSPLLARSPYRAEKSPARERRAYDEEPQGGNPTQAKETDRPMCNRLTNA